MLELALCRNRIEYLSFTPDGRYLIAADHRGAIIRWDVATHEKRELYRPDPMTGFVNGLAIPADGEQIYFTCERGLETVTFEGVMRRWFREGHIVGTGLCLNQEHSELFWAGFEISGSGPPGRILSWQMQGTGARPRWEIITRSLYISLAYLPDGDRFACLETEFADNHETCWLRLRSTTDGEQLAEFLCPKNGTTGLLLSPDGQHLIARSGNALLIWNTHELHKRPIKRKNTCTKHFTGAAFHPAGGWLAVASNDDSLKLFDCQTWQVARTWDWRIGRLRSVAFSPDGTLAAVGSATGRVMLWDF